MLQTIDLQKAENKEYTLEYKLAIVNQRILEAFQNKQNFVILELTNEPQITEIKENLISRGFKLERTCGFAGFKHLTFKW